MFNKYYQGELSYLREMGRAFAQANPSIAALLSERGGDPDVERLLEGFAFLTAQIRQRIDDAVPEVVHGLTELLLPHYLRPLPACSIVELLPQLKGLRGRTRVAQGTPLGAKPLDGASCTFRTAFDTELVPVALLETSLDATSSVTPRLRLQFQTTEQSISEVFRPEGLRLFIHAELPLAATVFLWLCRHLRSIRVRDPAKPGSGVDIPTSALIHTGLSPHNALFPWPRGASDGHRVVQELFTLPQKFLFFDLRELDRALGLKCERFEVVLEFADAPALPSRVTKDLFRLHSVPVVNLFAVPADPIRRDALTYEYPLRATGLDPLHAEVYSVDAVTGIQAGRGERKSYPPFFAFSHMGAASTESFYRVRRTNSPVNDGMDAYLVVGTPQGVAPELSEETLSVDLTCTNRSLPARLQIGDISVATAGSPTVAQFRNIAPVTRPIRPPLGSELHWRLLSHLGLNQRSLADATTLRALLEQYNFQALADHAAGRANTLRIEGIREVRQTPVRRFIDRSPVRGTRTEVELLEASFAGLGDAFLFGAVLDQLLASNVTLNSFNELRIRLQPSQQELQWAPRNGTQPLL